MDNKIVWSKPALIDIKAICEYIGLESPTSAVKVGQEILAHVKVLESLPYIGPAYPRYGEGQVREILCGQYRIFYQIKETQHLVEVLRVWHGKQKPPPRLHG